MSGQRLVRTQLTWKVYPLGNEWVAEVTMSHPDGDDQSYHKKFATKLEAEAARDVLRNTVLSAYETVRDQN